MVESSVHVYCHGGFCQISLSASSHMPTVHVIMVLLVLIGIAYLVIACILFLQLSGDFSTCRGLFLYVDVSFCLTLSLIYMFCITPRYLSCTRSYVVLYVVLTLYCMS